MSNVQPDRLHPKLHPKLRLFPPFCAALRRIFTLSGILPLGGHLTHNAGVAGPAGPF